MKLIKLTTIIFLISAFLLLYNASSNLQCAENVNQCVACHTSAKNLIKITREIAETGQYKPAISSENSGEG